MFRFHLETVLAHRQFIEDNLQRELAGLEKKYSEMESSVLAMQERIELSEKERFEKQENGILVSENRLFIDYRERLYREIDQIRGSMKALSDEISKKRRELLEAVRRKKTIEKLKEKQWEDYQEKERKRERKMIDEATIHNFGRNDEKDGTIENK